MKTDKRKIVAAVLTILAVLNLIVLFVWPDLPGKLTGVLKETTCEITEHNKKGTGASALHVKEETRTFNGKGIFDPMEGVKATDTDGSDLTGKTAVSYVPGRNISEKEIHYTVFDSAAERLEAVCSLTLENYKGPSISFENPGKISWEELTGYPETVMDRFALKADDGFGNNAKGGVSFSYEILEGGREVEVTFSLINEFRDFQSKKALLIVDDIPADLAEGT